MNETTDDRFFTTRRIIAFLFGEDGNTLTGWVKVFGVLGAFLYAIGTLVANGALVNMGTSEFTWAPPQAVLTGLWCVSALAVTICPGAMFQLLMMARPLYFTRYFVGVLILAASSLVIALSSSVLLQFVFLLDLQDAYTIPTIGDGRLFLVKPIIQLLVVSDLIFLFAPWFAKSEKDQKTAVALLSTAVSIVGILVVMPRVFEDIPAARGGGKPEAVALVLNRSGASAIAAFCGLSWKGDGALSGKVTLLFDTGSQYILWIAGSRLVAPRTDPTLVSTTQSVPQPFHGGQLVHLPKSAVDAVWLLDYHDGRQAQLLAEHACALKPLQPADPQDFKKL